MKTDYILSQQWAENIDCKEKCHRLSKFRLDAMYKNILHMA